MLTKYISQYICNIILFTLKYSLACTFFYRYIITHTFKQHKNTITRYKYIGSAWEKHEKKFLIKRHVLASFRACVSQLQLFQLFPGELTVFLLKEHLKNILIFNIFFKKKNVGLRTQYFN